ncbi:glycosyltransferase family protein [Bosea thiooxidans]
MSSPLHNETLKGLETKLGRPLRVLHIGNIANNAYNNARIQRQYGIEADVLSYDYYHVMSTPEWEDAKFEGEIDQDAPNWWGSSLKGWQRPDWFVQGPASACLQYLRAKRFGYRRLQKLLWRYLEAKCLGQVRYTADLKGQPLQPMPLRLGIALKAAERLAVANGPAHRVDYATIADLLALKTSNGMPLFPVDRLDPKNAILFPPQLRALANEAIGNQSPRRSRRLRLFAKVGYRILFDHLVRDGLTDPGKPTRLAPLWLGYRRWRRPDENREILLEEVRKLERGAVLLRGNLSLLRNGVAITRTRGRLAIRSALLAMFTSLSAYLYRSVRPEGAQLSAYNATISTVERDKRFSALVEENSGVFERFPPDVRNMFLVYYAIFGAQFVDIFGFYDIVQTYSIDGCLCAVNGYERFISYEHGTLRDMPFGNDFYGIVTPLAYHASTYVFVTNSDVLPSVARMGLDPARVTCLPHAFDDRKLMEFRAEKPDLAPPVGPPVIFSPTRQHWKDKSGSWTKGNDILFRAAAMVASEGHEFRLHLIAWGKEIEDSKALISELGIAEKVSWLPTMQKRELWEAYCTAHAVADQFTLPALGGVGFETMALGRRLITAIDETQLTYFFGMAPPCLTASTVEECAAQLRRVIMDPQDEAALGTAAQEWMRTYHSAERIVDLQATRYRQFLETNGGGKQD